MPRSTAEHPEKSRGTNLLQEFEDSLPDFKSLDEEQHIKFVKTIRLLCGYFDGIVTLPWGKREASAAQEFSGCCDGGPPCVHRDSAKLAVRLG
jgi:hypothetical protein